MRLLYREARHRVEVIADAISEIDDRIQGIVRFNVLILGLFVPGVSLLLRTRSLLSIDVGQSAVLFAAGFGALILSTVSAISAYLKRGTVGGIDTQRLAETLDYDVTEIELRAELVRTYRLAGAAEEAILERTAQRFRVSLYTLILGLLCLLAATVTLWAIGGR